MRYKILLKNKVDADLLKEIQSEHSMDVEGINDLYNLLITDGTCDSDIVSRIYYVSYTLALRSIEIIIVKLN